MVFRVNQHGPGDGFHLTYSPGKTDNFATGQVLLSGFKVSFLFFFLFLFFSYPLPTLYLTAVLFLFKKLYFLSTRSPTPVRGRCLSSTRSRPPLVTVPSSSRGWASSPPMAQSPAGGTGECLYFFFSSSTTSKI